MTTKVTPPSVKISLPEFPGETVDQWLEFAGSLRIEFARNPDAYPDEAAKVALAMSLFRGEAMSWLNAQSDDKLKTFLGSYVVFGDAVRTQFGLADNSLVARGRQRIDDLHYDTRDPHRFFSEATLAFMWQGIHTDASRIQAIWHKLPHDLKQACVIAGELNPSWNTLRATAVQLALVAPSRNPKKPKCKACGKKHNGECRSKN